MVLQINTLAVEKPRSVVLWSLASRGASRLRIVGRPTKHRFAIYQLLDEVDRRYLQPDLSPTRESLENGMRRVAEIDRITRHDGEKDVQLAPRIGEFECKDRR